MTEAEQEHRSVLAFRGAAVVATERSNVSVALGDVTLATGEMAVVEVTQRGGNPPLAAAAEGLLLKGPSSTASVHIVGDVLFEGRSWYDGNDRRHLVDRGRIGRVFESEERGWISNLTVMENVLLSRLHHTSDPRDRVLADAQQWAKGIGLDDVPRQHPAFVSDWRLRLAQWVRALVIQPALLILEHPTRSVPESFYDRMRAVIEQVRSAGTAVLWISSDPRVLESVRETATVCYQISVGQMVRKNR